MLAGPLTPSDMGVALGYRVPLPDHGNFQTVIAFLPGWDGYVWAFPGTDCVSIGIATSQPTFNHERLEAMLLDFIDRYYQQRWNNTLLGSISKAQVKTLRAEIELRADRYAARIPNLDQSTLEARRLVGSDWALIGDAAGFADAITGEGIYYALRSAELFAESYLKGNAEEYETRWRTEFGEELMRAAKLRSTFYGKFFGNTFTHRMIQCSILHPGIRRTLVELIAGDLPYSQLKRTLVRRLAST